MIRLFGLRHSILRFLFELSYNVDLHRSDIQIHRSVSAGRIRTAIRSLSISIPRKPLFYGRPSELISYVLLGGFTPESRPRKSIRHRGSSYCLGFEGASGSW